MAPHQPLATNRPASQAAMSKQQQENKQQGSQLLHSVPLVAQHAAPAAGQQAVWGGALAPAPQAPCHLHLREVLYAGFEAQQDVCSGARRVGRPLRDERRRAAAGWLPRGEPSAAARRCGVRQHVMPTPPAASSPRSVTASCAPCSACPAAATKITSATSRRSMPLPGHVVKQRLPCDRPLSLCRPSGAVWL